MKTSGNSKAQARSDFASYKFDTSRYIVMDIKRGQDTVSSHSSLTGQLSRK